MKLSLGFKLNGAILVSFLLVAVVFTVFYLPSQARRRGETMNNAEILLDTLVSRDHDPLAYELFDGRLDAARIRLEEMLLIGEIRAISLRDFAGRYLLSVEANPERPIASRTDRSDMRSQVSELSIEREPYMRFDAEISLGGEPIGYLEILYSFSEVYSEQRREFAIYGGLMAAMLTLVLTVLNILTSRIILRPIHLLSVTMELMRREGPGLQVEAKSVDEIGELSVEFNRMSSALEESELKIRSQQTDLGQSQERYRTLFESAGDALVVHDMDGAILDVNQKTVECLGYSYEELIACNVRDLVVPEWRHAAGERIDQIRGEGSLLFEVLHQSKAGERIPFEITAAIFEFRGRPAILGILRDLRRRRELEDQLRQSQKMEAIGLLAGGIAHDFNNLLTTILGYTDVIRMEESLSASAEEGLAEITRAGKSAATLIQQLLAFGRKQTLEPRVIDLHELVFQTKNMLGRLIGENIALDVEIDSKSILVLADPGQVEQVLINLSVNARDAMPDGGRLCISAKNVHLSDGDTIDMPGTTAGRYVRLVVSDTGTGIPPEIMDQIFDPFFSTKSVGRGTGLGLSTVYGIVKQSRGQIAVRSEIGVGTTFEIHFPAGEKKTVEETKVEPKRTLDGGGETILLVEDEEILRRMATRVLENIGYTIVEAGNGVEALEYLSAGSRHNVDLVLTDIIMPEMGGRELAEKAAIAYPELKTIFMSGYAETANSDSSRSGGVGILKKPFTAAELADRVRKALDL